VTERGGLKIAVTARGDEGEGEGVGDEGEGGGAWG
jgi:hypothetical protein